MIQTEQKYIEILLILKEHSEPLGAKRLSEMLAERGYIMTDRAVQYYLRYLDNQGFTTKVGNHGRILTQTGLQETERALVDSRVGYIISHLEHLAYKSTFEPETGTGDVAYNLTIFPEENVDLIDEAFSKIKATDASFFHGFRLIDRHPGISKGELGAITICSITMDGVLQQHNIPTTMAYGGRLEIHAGTPVGFADLIAYKGCTIDPLALFLAAGLTSIGSYIDNGTGTVLANIRRVPQAAEQELNEICSLMHQCGFSLPIYSGREDVFRYRADPHRISLIQYSGMNYAGYAKEKQFPIKTEIGAGTIPFSRIAE